MRDFDWRQYILNYPDLQAAGINNYKSALGHYQIYGKNENRFYTKINKSINPVIVCIAKYEKDYIKYFIDYHLALGFDKIFLYDNEDTPVYSQLLNNDNVVVTHLPGNSYNKGVQYIALEHFVTNFMKLPFTHVAHIDIDEYITLKKHNNIKDFIRDYIINDCAGIGMNWRYFGSNGQTQKELVADPLRFTKCEINGNVHIKTLFEINSFKGFKDVHSIHCSKNKFIKSTFGNIIGGPFNECIDYSIIQLNHYKCKTLPEFIYIRSRGRADLNYLPPEDIEKDFKMLDTNEMEELTCYNFYSSNFKK